jgi:hypothetical protein
MNQEGKINQETNLAVKSRGNRLFPSLNIHSQKKESQFAENYVEMGIRHAEDLEILLLIKTVSTGSA